MNNLELENLSTCIFMLAQEADGKNKINLFLQNIFENYEKEACNNSPDVQLQGATSVPIFFSEKELSKLRKHLLVS
jgi:hypothetical protein